MTPTPIRRRARIPKHVLDLLWEYPKRKIAWPQDADLIIRRVLESGGWDSVRWLIVTVGYAWLKRWMVEQRGAGLDPKRLRFWQLALNLPEKMVDLWIAENSLQPWHQRLHP